jgi:hypothetical protein
MKAEAIRGAHRRAGGRVDRQRRRHPMVIGGAGTGDGTRLGVGGDFRNVNNPPQQGFTQFG